MNEEDEVDANGMPTERAVEAMTGGVAVAYGFLCDARAGRDVGKAENWANRVRIEMGGLLQAIGKALGDLPGGRVGHAEKD